MHHKKITYFYNDDGKFINDLLFHQIFYYSRTLKDII